MAITEELTNIANAIRTKTGSSETMKLNEMATNISNIQTHDDSKLIQFIERASADVFEIPKGTTEVGLYSFISVNYKEVTIPNTVTYVRSGSFSIGNVSSTIQKIIFEDFDEGHTDTCLLGCFLQGSSNLKEVIFKRVYHINEGNCLYNCANLTTVYLPNTLTSIVNGLGGFMGNCTNLEFVTLEDDFNCNSLKLQASTKYSVETIISWLNALKDRRGTTAYTLTMGSTNLAKLSETDIAIATVKNWTLA